MYMYMNKFIAVPLWFINLAQYHPDVILLQLNFLHCTSHG